MECLRRKSRQLLDLRLGDRSSYRPFDRASYPSWLARPPGIPALSAHRLSESAGILRGSNRSRDWSVVTPLVESPSTAGVEFVGAIGIVVSLAVNLGLARRSVADGQRRCCLSERWERPTRPPELARDRVGGAGWGGTGSGHAGVVNQARRVSPTDLMAPGRGRMSGPEGIQVRAADAGIDGANLVVRPARSVAG